MNDYSERENSESKAKNTKNIVDAKMTQNNLRNQLRIVQKIICSISWMNQNKFTNSITYEISKFIFRNPLTFKAPVFKHIHTKKLDINSRKSYILVNAHLQRHSETTQKCNSQYFMLQKSKSKIVKRQNDLTLWYHQMQSFKSGQYAINIKVLRFWKSCKIDYANSTIRQIIAKSKHFIDFLKNIKIDNPKQQNNILENNFETGNGEEKQAKLFTLVCQNYDYILSKITQIQQNQKHKKLDHSIAKTYVQMMNKNILILNVEKNNFNPISYKSQGKYVYVQNSLKLPLVSQKFNRIYAHIQSYKIDKSHLKFIPYLECSFDGQWLIKNASHENIQLFEQNGKQTDRGQGLIIDRFLNCFQYDDYFVKEI